MSKKVHKVNVSEETFQYLNQMCQEITYLESASSAVVFLIDHYKNTQPKSGNT